MKNLKTIVAILVFAGLLSLLAVPYTSSNSFYNESFPEDSSFFYGQETINVDLSEESDNSLEYILTLKDEESDLDATSYGEAIAQKAVQAVEDNLRELGVEDGTYNIYTSKNGDNYSLIIEGEDLDRVKSAVPAQLFFENGMIGWFKNKGLTLGLDLQGGVQLDYLIDLSGVEADRIDSVVQGNLATVERRVNKLGVSEPNIYLSQVGDEMHIVVELAGVKDINEAKAQIGKTVQLEFKEARSSDEEVSDEDITNLANEAQAALAGDPDHFRTIALQYQSDHGDEGVTYSRSGETFVDEIGQSDVATALEGMQVNAVSDVIRDLASYSYDVNTQSIVTNDGLYIVKLLETGSDTKEVTHDGEDFFTAAGEVLGTEYNTDANETFKSTAQLGQNIADTLTSVGVGNATDIIETDDAYKIYHVGKIVQPTVKASHILVSYEGASKSEQARSKAEAYERAQEVLAKVQAGENFATLAQEYSDGPTATNGGDLGEFSKGQMATEFENAAFAMEDGDTSDIVETEFGYHIIKRTGGQEEGFEATEISLPKTDENKAKLEDLLAKMEETTAEEEVQTVNYDQLLLPFDSSNWVSTGLDGEHFVNASLQYNTQVSQYPYIQIQFDDEGKDMFADLTERLKGKSLAIFVGGDLVSAPTVNEKITGGTAQITGKFTMQEASDLANDLNSGAIPAPLELSAEYTVSPTLGADALSSSIYAGAIGLLIVALYMIFYYRVPGLIAGVALVFYSLILIAILKYSALFGMDIVLTLAGIAGVILSIGMAVDANVLIFERLKEEMRSGKSLATSLEIGFERAWTSIRDANVSSLITCIILYWFGSSIIRGFAVMLGIGILISMFTAIVLTRGILGLFVNTKLAREHRWLFGDKK